MTKVRLQQLDLFKEPSDGPMLHKDEFNVMVKHMCSLMRKWEAMRPGKTRNELRGLMNVMKYMLDQFEVWE